MSIVRNSIFHNEYEMISAFSLDENKIIITGVSGAIGSACAKYLLEAGASVIGVDIVRNDCISNLVKTYRNDNKMQFILADITSEDGLHKLLRLLDPSIITDVVCTAGTSGQIADAETQCLSEFEKCISASLTTSMLMIKGFTPYFKEKRVGNYILFSSVAGLKGNALMPAYTAAKHGIIGLTRSYARELGPHGIRVNALLPGLIDSPMAIDVHQRLESRRIPEFKATDLPVESIQNIPLRRVGSTYDVACAVHFLLSKASAYCTGISLPVDGGVLVR